VLVVKLRLTAKHQEVIAETVLCAIKYRSSLRWRIISHPPLDAGISWMCGEDILLYFWLLVSLTRLKRMCFALRLS